jgi:hypothetical protein
MPLVVVSHAAQFFQLSSLRFLLFFLSLSSLVRTCFHSALFLWTLFCSSSSSSSVDVLQLLPFFDHVSVVGGMRDGMSWGKREEERRHIPLNVFCLFSTEAPPSPSPLSLSPSCQRAASIAKLSLQLRPRSPSLFRRNARFASLPKRIGRKGRGNEQREGKRRRRRY